MELDLNTQKLYEQHKDIVDKLLCKEAYEVYPLRAPTLYNIKQKGDYLIVILQVSIKENYKTYRFVKLQIPQDYKVIEPGVDLSFSEED